ncbi:MAG: hypothetical protein LQ347_006687 [Umbilicaria vellea]|nr:MAG: hypothetical protein LQ347_006687 [Umbilicaria vellea]
MLTHCQDIHRVLEVIHTRVRSRQDGLDLLSNSAALFEALQKSQHPVKILRAINIIFTRLHHVGVELNKASLVYGIQCAAHAGSFEALQLYLSQAFSYGHKLALHEFRSLMQNLYEYVIKNYKEDTRSWDGRRRKQQLLRVVTGWQCDGVRRPGEERQYSIHSVMRKFQGSEVSLWENHTCILRIAGGKDVLFDEWLDFNRPQPDPTSSGKDNNNERIQIAGLFASNLVLANDAERAWQVIQDTGSDVGAVDDTTWSLLLDHPQHIRNWQAAMAEKVIKKYEESVVRIEAAMGITWSGGEDGYHITTNQEKSAEGQRSLRNPKSH